MKQKNWYEYIDKNDLYDFYNTIPFLNKIEIYGTSFHLNQDIVSVELGFKQEIDKKPINWKLHGKKFVKCEFKFFNVSVFELTKNINTGIDLIEIEQMSSEKFSIISKGRINFKFVAGSFEVNNVTWDFYNNN